MNEKGSAKSSKCRSRLDVSTLLMETPDAQIKQLRPIPQRTQPSNSGSALRSTQVASHWRVPRHLNVHCDGSTRSLLFLRVGAKEVNMVLNVHRNKDY